MILRNSLLMESQPEAHENTRLSAVISWHYRNGVPTVISRYSHMVWEGAPVGVMAAMPTRARQVDFSVLPEWFIATAKDVLYAAMRHPVAVSTTLSFATLRKRFQALVSLSRHLVSRGLTLDGLSRDEMERFIEKRTAEAKHIETVVSLLSAIRGASLHFRSGLIPVDLLYPYSLERGAPAAARAVWLHVHKADFLGGGDVPFDDEDLTLIIRNSRFYTDELGGHICESLEKCLAIAEESPERISLKAQDTACYRQQVSYLSKYSWPHSNAGIYQWPPKNMRELLGHARMCTASAAITISFSIGGRASEINSIKDDCIQGGDGARTITLTHYKGEDQLNGRLVSLPVDEFVVDAINNQKRIKSCMRRYVSTKEASSSSFTDHLFVQFRGTPLLDKDDTHLLEEELFGLEDGRISSNALARVLTTFKDRVVPDIDGTLSFTRFRKSLARLMTLSMEGSTVVLQRIFGHASYRTTLGYMFSSPMIQEELVTAYPEMMARNLRVLYEGRDSSFGGGAAGIRSAIQTGGEKGMEEDEFVQLGLDMMEMGQMVLSLLGRGMYCLKPAVTRGLCSSGPRVTAPDLGRCNPLCSHHILLGSERPRMIRQLEWISGRLAESNMSPPMRKFYERYHAEFTTLLSST